MTSEWRYSVFSKLLTPKFLTYFKINYVSRFLRDLNSEIFYVLHNKVCSQFFLRSWLWYYRMISKWMSSVFSKLLTPKFLTYFKINYVSRFLRDLNSEIFDLLHNKLCFQFCLRSWLWYYRMTSEWMSSVFSKILTPKFLTYFKINYASTFLLDLNSEIFVFLEEKLCFQFSSSF